MRRKFLAAGMAIALCSAALCGCSNQNGDSAGKMSGHSENSYDTDAYTSDNDGNQYGGDMQSAVSSIQSTMESAAGSIASGVQSMMPGEGR